MSIRKLPVFVLCTLLVFAATCHGRDIEKTGRRQLKQWNIFPNSIPPGPPPQWFPPPPPPPPFNPFPVFDLLFAIPDIIKGALSIPGAIFDMIWNQSTMYGPVVGDILRGSQAGAQQKIIDGELRKSMDINIILNGATQIALPFKQYTAPIAFILDFFG